MSLWVMPFGFDGARKQVRQSMERFAPELDRFVRKTAFDMSRTIVIGLTDGDVIDTGRLRASYDAHHRMVATSPRKGKPQVSGDDYGSNKQSEPFTWTVGTNVEYAKFVEETHPDSPFIVARTVKSYQASVPAQLKALLARNGLGD